MKLKPNIVFDRTKFVLLFLFLSMIGVQAQTTDLSVRFLGQPPTRVAIGEAFAIQAEVFHANGASLPVVGETITATIDLIDPNGIVISTYVQSSNGFPNPAPAAIAELDNDSTGARQVIFQLPWTEAGKINYGPDLTPFTNDDSNWSVAVRVTSPSLETNVANNSITHSLFVDAPDLRLDPEPQLRAKHPQTGQLTTNLFPDSRIEISGTISNIGNAMTQPGARFTVEARLFEGSITSNGFISKFLALDYERVILPASDGVNPPTILAGNSVPFTISNLRLPADAEGNFTIQVIADVPDQDNVYPPPGNVVEELEEFDNNHQIITFTVNSGTPDLQINPNSFQGDIGTFNGLDPIRIAFAIRNEGTGAVQPADNFTVRVALSTNDSFSNDDFILREFDLSGDALGANLLPNETINLDWVQQLPDNFEGDFYILVNVETPNQPNQSVSFSNTPILTLKSLNNGQTMLVDQNSSFIKERPSSSADGKIVTFEYVENGIRQIAFRNVKNNSSKVLVTENLISKQSGASVPSGGNADSFRPKVSKDGNTIVFHSRANDLSNNDSNSHEDVFLYNVLGKVLLNISSSSGQKANGGSFYPDTNYDGTHIVFESAASNLSTIRTFGQRQVFLWKEENNAISQLTEGNGRSHSVSISDDGNRIVFVSEATNLVAGEPDSNGVSDIFLYEANTSMITRLNKNYLGLEAAGGFSDQTVISGDGKTVAFRSLATNLVTGKGISNLSIETSGVGYYGNPTIVVNDPFGNGEGAELAFTSDAIDLYGQIRANGIEIISSGNNYSDPQVTIIPDPNFPAPIQVASIQAHLTHPLGEIYSVNVDSLLSNDFSTIKRISENYLGVGGDMPSREPDISDDGKSIVYSTQASNLLGNMVTRADGKVFYNQPVRQARAQAILVGGIGEIEVLASGAGYSNGFLSINDVSGGGSGAIASYEVDSFGRISSVTMVNPGTNYNLATSVVQVDNPRGGSGFVAGALRFAKETGIGGARVGGGKVHRVEMIEHGMNYQTVASSTLGLQSLLAIDGDGVDADNDGKPDAKLNPERIKIDSKGGIYLEQVFDISVTSTSSLLATTLGIEDANKSIFINFANSDSLPFTIGINNRSLSQIRDKLTEVIWQQWDLNNSSTIYDGPIVEGNATGGTTFTLRALSGKVAIDNSSSIQVNTRSNMLFSGSGFTRATPYIAPPPTIHGFSEISSQTTVESSNDGRQVYSAQTDLITDDIYLHNSDTGTNERVSTSTFGFPANYLNSGATSTPSNRFPSISGNGRQVFFSSDAQNNLNGSGGLVFDGTNQNQMQKNNRDIYFKDLMTESLYNDDERFDHNESLKITLMQPAPNMIHEYALGTSIQIYGFSNLPNSEIEKVEFYVNDELKFTASEVYKRNDENGYFPISYYTSVIYDEQEDSLKEGGTPIRGFQLQKLGNYEVYIRAYPRNGESPVKSDIGRFSAASPSHGGPSKVPGLILKNPMNETTYTSSSKDVLLANGWDPDGDYDWTEFYVNGANAQIQFNENPENGDVIVFNANETYGQDVTIRFGNDLEIKSTVYETVQELAKYLKTYFPSAREFRRDTVLINSNRPDSLNINPQQRDLENKNADFSQIRIKAQVFKRIYRPTGESPQTYPFTNMWSPFLPGFYVIHAVGQDTSGNKVSSQPVYVSSTKGSEPPKIEIKAPNKRAKAKAEVDTLGEISKITIDSNFTGSAYEIPPLVLLAGDGKGARARANLHDNGTIKAIEVEEPGTDYTYAEVVISPKIDSLLDGAVPIVNPRFKYSEQVDISNKQITVGSGNNTQTVTQYRPGTFVPFKVIETKSRNYITGFEIFSKGSQLDQGVTAKLVLNTGVVPLNNFFNFSDGELVPPTDGSNFLPLPQEFNASVAQVIFEDTGLNRGSISIKVDAEAANSTIKSTLTTVVFYVDGEQLGADSIPPFIQTWRPDRPGFFSVWAVAIDDRGNKICSDPLIVTTQAFGSPIVSIVNPLGTPGDAIEISLGSRIPLVVDARAKIGDINGSNSVRFTISDGSSIQATQQGNTSRFEASWVPSVPGNYKIYSLVNDSEGQETLSEPTFVEVIENGRKSGGGGSLTPQVKMVYPQPRSSAVANLPVGQPINGVEYSRPLSNRTIVVPDDLTVEEYAFTSTSTVRLFARAGDYDGDLIGVQFYVNGTQGSMQFREVPLSGTQIKMSDGLSKSADPLNPDVFILEFNNNLFDGNFSSVIFGGAYDENSSSAIDDFESYLQNLDPAKITINSQIYLPILPKREDCAEILFKMLDFLNTKKNLNVTPIEYRNFNGQLLTILLKYQDTRYAVLESNPPNDEGYQNTHHARVFVQLLKEILRGDTLSPWSHPYGHMWTPGLDGTYTIQSRARDNSGNYGWSKTVTVTSTTGSTPPKTEITSPITVSNAHAVVNQATGKISNVNVTVNGSGHMRKPEVEALEDIQPWFNIEGNDSSPKFLEEGRDSGPGPGGEILESLNLDPNGTVVGVKIKSPGVHFYKPEVKVRPILKSVTNGVSAVLEADLYEQGADLLGRPYGIKTDNVQRIHVRNGGKGYAYPPKIRIIGDGFGAEAVANVDLDPASDTFGEIISVDVTDQGMDYTETPIVEVYGGFGLDQVLVEANATATGDNKLLHVEFYADGILLDRVKTKPYHTIWYPGQEGIHEVYSVTRDDKGNRYTSEPLQFSIHHVDGPEVKLISPIGDLLSNSKFGKGGWPTFVAETDPGQAKVWKVEFQVDTMDRVNALWRGSSEDFLNNRWQYTWDPRGNDRIINTADDNTYAGIPGKYKVRAIVTDHHQMIGLSEPEVFEIVSIKGSQAPDNNMTFPVLYEKDNNPLFNLGNGTVVPDDYVQEAVDNIELVSLTTNSRYVFSTQANDPDGALRGVQYEVDGANVHFQFLENPKDGDTLELHNHDTFGTDHPPLLICVFKTFLSTTQNQYDPINSKQYYPQKPKNLNLGNTSLDNLDKWKASIPTDGSFEVQIGPRLENYTDENGNDYNGTLHNFMELLRDISADTDDDLYTDLRELYLISDPLNERIYPPSDNDDLNDPINFNKNSKFLARSNGLNAVRLKVYDPRGLFVTSSNPLAIHVQAFPEVPHQSSSSNDLQVFSHQYWEPKLEGEYTVQSIAVDTTGNATPSTKVGTLLVTKGAENKPEVSLSYFSDTLPLGSNINLRANVSDYNSAQNKGEIQFVGFLVNGRIYGPLDSQSPFFTTLSLTEAGRYEIFAFAGDDEGNINFSRRRSIRVYTDSPFDLSTEKISSSRISISTGRRSTTISGLVFPVVNDSNSSILPKNGTRIRFQMDDDLESLSELSYTVNSIDSNGTLTIDEALSSIDRTLLESSSVVEVLEVFKVGSQIYFPVSQKVNQGTLSSVQFFSNGESLDTDFVAPYSAVFTPTIGGIYSLTAISTSYSGLQNILERKIFVEDKEPNTRMPYGSIEILPDLSGYSYTWNNLANNVEQPVVVGRGSTLVARANFEDLDGTIQNLNIYLNGEVQSQPVEGANSISFTPYSISDANIVQVTAVAEDNDGNMVVEERTILVYDPAPFPELKLDPPAGNDFSILDGETSIFNVSSSGILTANLQSASMQVQSQSANSSLRNCMLVGNGRILGYAEETGIGSGRFTFEWNVDADFASPDGLIQIRALMPSSELSSTTGNTFFFNLQQSAALMGVDPSILRNQVQGQGGGNLPSITFNGNNSVFSIVSSEPIIFELSHKNPFASVEEATSQVIEDLLNRSPSQAEIQEAVSQINRTDLSHFDPIEDRQFLSWVSKNLVARQGFKNIADSVGTYKTVVGLWPSSNEIDRALSVYVAFPNYGDDGSGDSDQDGYSDDQERSFRTDPNDPAIFPQNGFKIGEYADDVLSSVDYLARHKPVPPLFGNDRFVRYEENRREFVNLLYKNKYGKEPTLQQTIQGAYRLAAFDPQSEEAQREIMLEQRQQLAMASMFGGGFGGQGGRGNQGGNQQMYTQLFSGLFGNQQQTQTVMPSYANPEPAILYISTFVLEEKLDTQDLIFGMPSSKNEFETVALMVNLWKENLGVVSYAEVGNLAAMSKPDRISAIMKDVRYRSRFPSVLRESVDIAENWKGSDWLGNYFYNEDSYPWVYHLDFGWTYLESSSDNNAWLYLPTIGWVWISKDFTTQSSSGATYTSYHEDGRYLKFDFVNDSSVPDIYYDYSAKRWRNYSK
ncbi:MAG: hypothetical protein VX038_03390 [Verrucomicrobiota bacterium]|nr:hypothetical protein [Verrucomicrobiota bacterium]